MNKSFPHIPAGKIFVQKSAEKFDVDKTRVSFDWKIHNNTYNSSSPTVSPKSIPSWAKDHFIVVVCRSTLRIDLAYGLIQN